MERLLNQLTLSFWWIIPYIFIQEVWNCPFCILWGCWPLGSGLWCMIMFLSFSHVVSWVRCGTWMYRFLIFAAFLTLLVKLSINPVFLFPKIVFILENSARPWWNAVLCSISSGSSLFAKVSVHCYLECKEKTVQTWTGTLFLLTSLSFLRLGLLITVTGKLCLLLNAVNQSGLLSSSTSYRTLKDKPHLHKLRGGSRISGKVVHVYKGMGESFCWFYFICLKYPMKMK